MRKINVNLLGPGFVLGCIIQLNWAKAYLVSNGLFHCIGNYGLRLLISGILLALVFLLIDQLICFKYRASTAKILSSFYFCASYLFFPPSTQLLVFTIILSLLIFPIYNVFLKPGFKGANSRVFKNIFYAYLSDRKSVV